MKPRDQRLLLTLVNISVLVGCSVFKPSSSETSPANLDSTQERLPAASDDTFADPDSTQENLPAASADTLQMPGGRLLFATREGDANLTSDVSYDYFVLNLSDKVVEPFPLLVDVNPITGSPVYSPDYSHLAFQQYDGATTFSIYLLGPENAEPHQINQRTDNVSFKELTWSSNGRFLTFESGGMELIFYLYDIETGSLDEIGLHSQFSQFPDLSPDGSQIAFSAQAFEEDFAGLYLMNSDGTDEHQLVAGQVVNLAWHPDGKRILYEKEITEYDFSTYTTTIVSPSQIYSYDLASGVEILLTPSDNPVLLHDFSPDGKQMIYTSQSGIYVISTEGGTPIDVTNRINGGWTWSPDSQHFATPVWNSGTESSAIYIVDAQGRGVPVRVYDDVHDVIAWLP